MEGQILQRHRKEKGLSISKLSSLTGISKSYISLLERGIQTNPSIDILEKLAVALKVDVESLVKNENNHDSSHKGKDSGMAKLRVEIELTEDQLSPQNLEKIKELLDVISTGQ